MAGPADLLSADGYVFATPENLASMSGRMKDFFDRTYYPVLGRIEGRPYGVMVCAGSDGRNAARQIERIATGWRLRAIAEPLIVCTHAETPEAILAPKNMTTDEYYQLMKLNSLDGPFYQSARSKYESQAMAEYRQKVRDELKKWHDEHFWQSFFSMNYLSDDMAMVDAVMDEASATGGAGSMR